jgi:hypothetical protein
MNSRRRVNSTVGHLLIAGELTPPKEFTCFVVANFRSVALEVIES